MQPNPPYQPSGFQSSSQPQLPYSGQQYAGQPNHGQPYHQQFQQPYQPPQLTIPPELPVPWQTTVASVFYALIFIIKGGVFLIPAILLFFGVGEAVAANESNKEMAVVLGGLFGAVFLLVGVGLILPAFLALFIRSGKNGVLIASFIILPFGLLPMFSTLLHFVPFDTAFIAWTNLGLAAGYILLMFLPQSRAFFANRKLRKSYLSMLQQKHYQQQQYQQSQMWQQNNPQLGASYQQQFQQPPPGHFDR